MPKHKRQLLYRSGSIVASQRKDYSGREQSPQAHKIQSQQYSQAQTQRIISRFHVLKKQMQRCSGDDKEMTRLQREIDSLGGMDAYQKASLLGQSKQRGGDSSKWLIKALPQGIKPADGTRLRLLDVGALDDNYQRYRSWLQVTAIDLNPQNAFVQKYDFMEYPLPDQPVNDEHFDILCLSLVLNFVPDHAQRGEMLRKAVLHLKINGCLFIVLPRPCVDNSRYFDIDLLHRLLESLGFVTEQEHTSLKLYYGLYRLMKKVPPQSQQCFSKSEIKTGDRLNNFCITLKAATGPQES
ncbi:hypothetical protein MP228_008819 [Amoeboaphelidium protococcarum]|nr:hypothetical protein MP228_008819 [Amoeboaphelidium protococcarum]